MKEATPKRLASLDSLRAVAIFLVLGRHMDWPPADHGLLNVVSWYWHQGGWIGVDLFFVLSGFLIGGLLFAEYKRYGGISYGRFFVRRGLKIYPPFFALLAVTIVVKICLAEPMPRREILGEVLFLQNYLGSIWPHTWSLAVEEHFYVLLPLTLLTLIRLNPKSTDPFARIPRLFLLLAVALLCARVLNACYWDHYTNTRCLEGTHLRIDSLMFGVVLSYCFHFRHGDFVAFVLPKRLLMAGLGIGLLVPAFCLPLDTPFIYTLGFTAFYLGSGLLLAAMVCKEPRAGPILRILAFIGAYSYSIYLWHMPFKAWLWLGLARFFGVESYTGRAGLFVCGSIVFGIVMGKVVEYPVLRLRDKFFPSRSGALGPDGSSGSGAAVNRLQCDKVS